MTDMNCCAIHTGYVTHTKTLLVILIFSLLTYFSPFFILNMPYFDMDHILRQKTRIVHRLPLDIIFQLVATELPSATEHEGNSFLNTLSGFIKLVGKWTVSDIFSS